MHRRSTKENVKLRYITPSITSKGWSVTDISMEAQVKFTDGKINLRGNFVTRGKAKYHEKRTALDAKIIQQMLGIEIK